jgi:hypothetical protein
MTQNKMVQPGTRRPWHEIKKNDCVKKEENGDIPSINTHTTERVLEHR